MPKKSYAERQNKIRATRSPSRTAKRRCRKCGKVGYYFPEGKQCRFLIGMLGTYICGGVLEKAPPPPKKEKPVAVLSVLPDVSPEFESHRLDQLRKATFAGRRVEALIAKIRTLRNPSRIKRVATSLGMWQRRQKQFEKRSRMSDVQLQQERDRRKTRKQRLRRGMAL